MQEQDKGAYLCEAGNGVGAELSHVVRLDVHIRPHFKNNYELVKLTKGAAIRLRCDAIGEKPLAISWTRDAIPINGDR